MLPLGVKTDRVAERGTDHLQSETASLSHEDLRDGNPPILPRMDPSAPHSEPPPLFVPRARRESQVSLFLRYGAESDRTRPIELPATDQDRPSVAGPAHDEYRRGSPTVPRGREKVEASGDGLKHGVHGALDQSLDVVRPRSESCLRWDPRKLDSPGEGTRGGGRPRQVRTRWMGCRLLGGACREGQ
jgi:hypothetical protein